MTIEKAIEILTYSSEHNTMLITGDEKDALRLGIEAMKRLNECRLADYMIREDLLPGETKD